MNRLPPNLLTTRLLLLTGVVLVSLILAACDALGAIAPTPLPTLPPTDTPTPAPALTPTPTLGPKEFVDAVYCWKSNIDTGSFGLIRFFGNGMIIDVSVAPFGSCDEAWAQMKQYLTLDAVTTVNHGEYHLSGTTVRWALAAANTSTIIGEVNGTIEGSKLLIVKEGAELEYIQLNP